MKIRIQTWLIFQENYQVVGDITKGSSLVPEYFEGVNKVINSVSVIVGPKEGDTPDRAKYSQVSKPKHCQMNLIISIGRQYFF